MALTAVAVLVGFALGRSSGDTDTVAGGGETTPATDPVPEAPEDDEPGDAGDDAAAGTDDEELSPIAAPATLDVTGLDGPALALAEAINRAAAMEYHARYEGETESDTGATTRLTVELWRRLPHARRDTTIIGDKELRTREFRSPDGVFGCIMLAPDPDYSCFPAESSTVDPSDPVFGAVDPRAGLVIGRAAEFEGEPVECWEVESIDEPTATPCVDGDGIPVVIDSGDGRLLRTLLDDVSDSGTFELPAPVEES